MIMVFNYVAGVSDDHSKNFSFIMDKNGRWRKSAVTIADFMDFAEDFVENPKAMIDRVINAVAKFGQWCDHYSVDAGTKKLIQNALDFIRPR